MDVLDAPQGELRLTRHPVRPADALRAWDAADEYLLHHLVDEAVDLDGTVAILNDAWGALSSALAPRSPVSISDSYVSHLAIAANVARNRSDAPVMLHSGLGPPPEHIDVLLLRIPKSLALLEDQLRRLAPSLHPGTVVIGGSMAKHLHSSTLEVFERTIGPTRTSRAVRKARLLFATPDPTLDPGPNPWPTSSTIAPDGLVVTSHAGVFAGDRLDIGTRLLLDHLPMPAGADTIVDLGCGNGILATRAAQADPDTQVLAVDESFRAAASAQATAGDALGADARVAALVGDGLLTLATGTPPDAGSVDLVLTNPPFHRDHTVGDAVAWQFFHEARTVLRTGGELWVVGNRHLGYHAKLRRVFGNADVVASNPKFVVIRATKEPGP